MMKSCKTCAFALDYELSPACKKCFHHSNWLEKVKAESIPMTNGDSIRAMSDEELAKGAANALSYCAPGIRPSPERCISEMCVGCWLKWLKQPHEDKEAIT